MSPSLAPPETYHIRTHRQSAHSPYSLTHTHTHTQANTRRTEKCDGRKRDQ